MAGGMAMGPGSNKTYAGHVTTYVIVSCIVAASGGALFGYDNGVTGGVVAMHPFLHKFFPYVDQVITDQEQNSDYCREHPEDNTSKCDFIRNPYCSFDSQALQWFTSSLFVAGMIAALPAGWFCKKYGRKLSMLVAGLFFDVGVVVLAAAEHISMLFIGRVLLGIAVAVASVAVTLYNSEMAPAQHRGRLNQIFQVILSLGIVIAQAINIGTQHLQFGWRISLACAGIPAVILTIGGIVLPDTPNSLIERGRLEEGRRVLTKIRGVQNVEEEFQDIVTACKVSNSVANPWANLFLKRSFRPQLFIAFTATFFQQWTGINTVIFYAPQLFIILGTGQSAALAATIVTGVINHLATYVSLWAADEFGRRFLLLEAGFQMVICLFIISITLATGFSAGPWVAWFVLVFMCIYISAYAWSWGPLAWLYPSEIQPLETRSAGQGIVTMVNLAFSFVIGQTYLSMLCAFQWGIFLFFGVFIVIATLVVYFLYPETKGLPIEECPLIFRHHWFWKRYAAPEGKDKPMLLNQMSSNSGFNGNLEMSTANGFNSGIITNPLQVPSAPQAPSGAITWLDREAPEQNAATGMITAAGPKSDDPLWRDN